MKAFAICLFVAVGVVHVNAGGYVLKGGVVDFGKPLDYFDQAVQAGETLFLVFNLNSGPNVLRLFTAVFYGCL